MQEVFSAVVQAELGDINSLQKQLDDAQLVATIQITNKQDILKDIKDITKSFKELQKAANIDFNNGNLSNNLPSSKDISKLESSLDSLTSSINEIRKAFGDLGKDSTMKPLLNSINSIETALSDVKGEFKELAKTMSSLNFSFNLDLGVKKNNPINNLSQNKNYVKNIAVPELERQVKMYEQAIMDWANKRNNSKFNDPRQAVQSLIGQASRYSNYLTNYWDTLNDAYISMSGVSGKKSLSADRQLEGFNTYFASIKEAAKVFDIDLSAIESSFSQTIDDFIDESAKIKAGANNAEEASEKLKSLQSVFTGDMPSQLEGIAGQMTELIQRLEVLGQKLDEINVSVKDTATAFNALNGTFEISNVTELTTSLDRLSTGMEQLLQNCAELRINLNGQLMGVTEPLQQLEEDLNRVSNIRFGYMSDEIQEMARVLQNFGFDGTSINNVIQDLDTMRLQVQSIRTQMGRDGQIRITVTGTDQLGRTVQEVRGVVNEVIQLQDGSLQAVTSTRLLSSSVLQEFNQAEDAFKRMLQLAKSMGGIEVSMVGLDPTENINEIQALETTLAELRAEYRQLEADFGQELNVNQWREIDRVFQESADNMNTVLGRSVDTANLENVRRETQNINKAFQDLIKTERQLTELDKSILKGQSSGKQEQEVQELNTQYERLTRHFMDLQDALSGNLSDEQFERLQRTVSESIDKIEILNRKIQDVRENLRQEISLKIKRGDIDLSLSNLEAQLRNVDNVFETTETSVDDLRTSIAELNEAHKTGNLEDIISAYNKYTDALKRAEVQVKANVTSEKGLASKDDIIKLFSDIDIWLGKNTKAAKIYGEQIDKLKAQLSDFENVTQKALKGAKSTFATIKADAQIFGNTGLTWIDRFKKSFSELSSWFSAYDILMEAGQALHSMFDNVVLIDSAMTELKKVTNETEYAYDSFLTNAGNKAKQLGTTIDGLVSSTADFARLGYGFEEAQELAEVANIYAVVGDEIESVDTATESLISTMAAFGDEVTAMQVIDKFNEIGNRFAISSGGIGEALMRSASSMSVANNTIDETIALVTAANTVVQDVSKVGNGLKTISMRIRGATTELADAGLETEGMAESTAKLQAEIKALSGVDIMLDKNNFKSTYQILDELAEKWHDLSDIAQASIVELLAGKHQGNTMSSLMENFDIARDALKASLESEGSAMREHEKWLESLDAKLLQLQASWQSLSQTFLDSEFLKKAIDLLIVLIDTIDKLIQEIGVIPTILGTIGGFKAGSSIFKAFKAFDGKIGNAQGLVKLGDVLTLLEIAFPKVAKAVTATGASIKTFATTAKSATSVIGLMKVGFSGLWGVISSHPIGALVTALGLLAIGVKKVSDAYIDASDANDLMRDSFDNYEDAQNELEDVNRELEETKQRIEELENKQGLSFVEEGELEKLREQTELLQIQADLAEKKAQKEARESAKSTGEAYAKNFTEEISADAVDWYRNNQTYINMDKLPQQKNNVSAMLAGLDILKETRDSLDATSDEWNYYNQQIQLTEDSIWEQVGLLSEYKTNLLSLSEEDILPQDEALLERITADIDLIYRMLDPAKWKQMKFDSIFESSEKYSDDKNKLIELAKLSGSVGLTVNDVEKDFSQLLGVVKSYGFEAQDLIDNINSEAGIIIKKPLEKVTTKFTNEQKQSVIKGLGNKLGQEITVPMKVAYIQYKQTLEEMESLGINSAQTLFGNIDLNNRQILDWTESNLNKYKDAIESWGMTADELAGDFSTVLGGYETFDGIDIAFTPLLQTDKGAVLLTQDSVMDYIDSLIKLATSDDGQWNNEELFKLDTQGIESDGLVIKNIIADIGDSAEKTSQAMHFGGKDGALANSFQALADEATLAGVTVDNLYETLANNDEITKWFFTLPDEEKEFVYRIAIQDDKTALWDLQQWQKEIQNIGECGLTSSEQMQHFYDIMNDTGESGLPTLIESYQTQISDLQTALTDLSHNKFDIVLKYPELAPYIDDTDKLRQAIEKLIETANQDIFNYLTEQAQKLSEVAPVAAEALLNLRDALAQINAELPLNLDQAIAQFNALYEAINQSVSGTGLTTAMKQQLDEMFSVLDSYDADKLFERTLHGIHINPEEQRRLFAELEAYNTEKIESELESLGDEYDVVTAKIENMKAAGTTDSPLYNSLIREQELLSYRIEANLDLMTQYKALTSDYNQWTMALSTSDEDSMFMTISDNLDKMKELFASGRIGTDDFREFVDLMTDADLSEATTSELIDMYQKGLPVMEKFFNGSSDGLLNFLNAANTVSKALGKNWVALNPDGSWDFNFGVGSDQELSKAIKDYFGYEMSTELVQIALRGLSSYGFDIDLDSEWTSLDTFENRAKEANEELQKLGATPIKIEADFTTLEEAKQVIQEIDDEIQKVQNDTSLSDAEKQAQITNLNVQSDSAYLRAAQLDDLKALNVESDKVLGNYVELYDLMNDYNNQANKVQILDLKGLDTKEAEENLKSIAKQIQDYANQEPEVFTKLGIEIDDTSIDGIQSWFNDLQANQVSIPFTLTPEQVEGQISDAIKQFTSGKESYDIAVAMNVDTSSALKDMQAGLEVLDSLSEDTKISLGIDTQTISTALNEVNAALNTIKQSDTSIQTSVTVDDSALNAVVANLNSTTIEIPAKITVDDAEFIGPKQTETLMSYNIDTGKVEEYQPEEKTSTVIWENDYEELEVEDIESTVIWTNDYEGEPNVSDIHASIIYDVVVNGDIPSGTTVSSSTIKSSSSSTSSSKSSGGARADGTAFVQGNWGTQDSGVALMGELGQETIVRNGRFFTVGDNGAEFVKYKKNDIIFNANQTQQLFKYGKIIHGKTRGRAIVNGTAFAKGTAFSSGSGTMTNGGNVIIVGSGGTTGFGGGSSGSSGGKTNGGASSSSSDEFKEVFDWIEVAIDRIERAIASLDLKASSIFQSWTTRNAALKDQIAKVTEEISLQEQAYARYIQEANSVGLSESWAQKVRDGAIDIDTIYDEGLAEQINQYKEWYEKALDCKDAIEELNESVSELYKQRFDNIITEYDGMLAVIEHERSMLETFIEQSEAKGYVTSTKYYDALTKVENENIEELKKEKEELLASLKDSMYEGAIAKESEAWYEMIASIDEVTLAIEESETAILEYANAIREIEWQVFDLLQDKISRVADESDFLISLFEEMKLFDERGQLTNEGLSTMGLHGVNYNVYMAQADKYAEELAKLDEQIAKTPYDQELIDRREEMLELQRDSILGAEAEKEAMISLVEEGIEIELEALEELIDKKNESLEAEKDLYEYQKKVKNQTKEIASLEKQMAAYAGDDSEETKAKIQQLKVSLEEAKTNLEEMEYDKFIDDQEELFDELYVQYEEILNARLDNIDALILDLIAEVNANAETISSTILDRAESVGYDITDDMSSIWSPTEENANVLTTYGEYIENGIMSAATTVNETLQNMNVNLQTMIEELAKLADVDIGVADKSSAINTDEANTAAKPKPVYTPPTYTPTSTPSYSYDYDDYDYDDDDYESPKKQTTTTSSSSSPSSSVYVVDVKAEGKTTHTGTTNTTEKPKDTPNGQYEYSVTTQTTTTKYSDGSSKTETTKYYDVVDEYGNIISGRYAKGVHNLSKDELAWTQENGREFILRPSDGAILTPLAQNDSVLTHGASNNIWNMANNPTDFIKDNLNLGVASIPNNNMRANVEQHFDQIVFSMPNVRNYEEMLNGLRKDPNFERLVMAMTLDQVAGKSSLSKGKSIR